jgi:hypothetical protein
MQIQVNNDFNNGGQQFTQAEINSFLQDEQTAINILDTTFTDNISVVLDVGFGSYRGQTLQNFSGAVSDINTAARVPLTYSQLRQDLLTFGEPGFFNAANLPAGDNLNGVTNFYVSSSVGKIFGLFTNQTDGFVGMGANVAPGDVRVDLFLHEMGHAMGRVPENLGGAVSALDLVRFVSPGNRLFDGSNPNHTFSYFSIDGGATQICQWGQDSDSGDFRTSFPFDNDPFNEVVGGLGHLTTADIQCMEALGYKTAPIGNPPPPPTPNPPLPAGTTADMILRGSNSSPAVMSQYEIYDLGNNAILAGYSLGTVGTDWQFAGLGRFFGSDTTDMLLRNTNTGGFEVYDISNNNITNAAFLGTVGMNWQVAGFADFNHDGMTDMVLRNSSTGGFEVYNVSSNSIINAAFLGTVGLNWQVGGFGNFSSLGESDMILRNSSTGGLEVYDISNNSIVNAAFMGTVGTNWQIVGVGNFSSMPGESDMIMRNTSTGGFEVYDIANNQIIGVAFLGTVGLDWQVAGFGPISGAGKSEMVLRNTNTGAFEVYDISNNMITAAASLGSVGMDWQLGGFAVDPPTGSMGDSSQAARLVQAMAGFGGGSGAAEGLNALALGAETSQQPLLTTPQHG